MCVPTCYIFASCTHPCCILLVCVVWCHIDPHTCQRRLKSLLQKKPNTDTTLTALRSASHPVIPISSSAAVTKKSALLRAGQQQNSLAKSKTVSPKQHSTRMASMMLHTSSLCAGGRSLHSGEGPAVDRHPSTAAAAVRIACDQAMLHHQHCQICTSITNYTCGAADQWNQSAEKPQSRGRCVLPLPLQPGNSLRCVYVCRVTAQSCLQQWQLQCFQQSRPRHQQSGRQQAAASSSSGKGAGGRH